jgi:hypothetical protein
MAHRPISAQSLVAAGQLARALDECRTVVQGLKIKEYMLERLFSLVISFRQPTTEDSHREHEHLVLLLQIHREMGSSNAGVDYVLHHFVSFSNMPASILVLCVRLMTTHSQGGPQKNEIAKVTAPSSGYLIRH